MKEFGLLVYNPSLKGDKYSAQTELIASAFARKGVKLEHAASDEILYRVGRLELCGLERPDFVLFWDKDHQLASAIEREGIRVFNSSETVRICDDKSLTHAALAIRNIPVPDTIIAPLLFFGRYGERYLDRVCSALDFPIVVKECSGSFGEQVYLASDRGELDAILKFTGTRRVIFQKFERESVGRDIRVNVVGGKIVAAVMRVNDRDFRSNASLGGQMTVYEPNNEERALALACAEAVGADFCGVDILLTEERKVLEVNSNARTKNILEMTGIDVGAAIADYVAAEVYGE